MNNLTLTFFLLFFCTLVSSVKANEIKEVNITPHDNNALIYHIEFETQDSSIAYIRYCSIIDNDTTCQNSPISPFGKKHRINLVGLTQKTSYQLHLIAHNGENSIENDTYSLTTEGLPADLVELTIHTNEYTEAKTDYIYYDFITVTFAQEDAYHVICNRQGQVVWYDKGFGWHPDMLPDSIEATTTVQACNAYHFTENATILALVGCHAYLEKTLDGEIIKLFSDTDQDYLFHHDLILNQDNNIVFITARVDVVNRSSVGGAANTILVIDGLIEKNHQDETLWTWDPITHFDPLYGGQPGAVIWGNIYGNQCIDWFHTNSIKQDFDGHYVLSQNYSGHITKINAQTGDVIWTLGKDGELELESGDFFAKTHDATITKDQTYLAFDNIGGFNNTSRIVEYEVDEVNKTAKQIWVYDIPAIYKSPFLGSAQRLDNGNTLIGCGTKGEIIEVTPEKEVVWQGSNHNSLFRAKSINRLYPPITSLELFDLPESICTNTPAFSFNTNRNGGYWEGAGIVDQQFDPQTLSPGAYQLVYHYAWHSDTINITLEAAPESPTIQGAQDSLWIETNNDLTIQWLLDGNSIENANQAWYKPQVAGEYSVLLDNGSCKAQSEHYTFYPTNINIAQTTTSISLFPNPVQDFFLINCPTDYLGKKISVHIFDLNGRIIHQFPSQKITSTSNQIPFSIPQKLIKNNIYLIEIQLGSQSFYHKIIHQ